jgi:hypothetical protein
MSTSYDYNLSFSNSWIVLTLKKSNMPQIWHIWIAFVYSNTKQIILGENQLIQHDHYSVQ